MSMERDVYEEVERLKEMADELGLNLDEVGDEICDDLRSWANDLFNTEDPELNEYMQTMFAEGYKSLNHVSNR